MALLGQAAVAMWWDIAREHRQEFEDWHSHEHFPERLGIPGFLRGSRWTALDGGDGYFVMYELDRHETLSSPGYVARLNQPTPWSTKMMPHHRGMVRSQCRVLDTQGGPLGGVALTLRLSARDGVAAGLQRYITALSRGLTARPGTVSAHLLQNRTPSMAVTTEQRIRGGPDPVADLVYIATGYDADALNRLRDDELSDAALAAQGAGVATAFALYRLSCLATPADFAIR